MTPAGRIRNAESYSFFVFWLVFVCFLCESKGAARFFVSRVVLLLLPLFRVPCLSACRFKLLFDAFAVRMAVEACASVSLVGL